MDIVLLGLDMRFIDELSELIGNNINCESVRSFFDKDDLFQRLMVEKIDILLVEINTRNFEICFRLVDQVTKKNSRVVIIFLCDYVLLDWQRKALEKQVYLLDKRQDYAKIISRISKVISWRDDKESGFEFEKLLTQREEDVIKLISQGMSQGDVAEKLCVARRTVQNHLASISEKLGTNSQIGSVVRAIELGIIAVDYEILEEF